MDTSYSILVTAGTHIVLAVSPWDPAIIFLNECTPDSARIYNAGRPNYTDAFFLSSCEPTEYIRWKWVPTARTFEKTPSHLLTTELTALSRLAVAKLNAYNTVSMRLNAIRSTFSTGIIFQESVYLAKKLQAQAFRDAGYDDSTLLEYPFVLQYADYAGISLKQAADDILFKAKLDDEWLSKTELLRLMYFNKIRFAKSDVELSAIVEAFTSDRHVSALT